MSDLQNVNGKGKHSVATNSQSKVWDVAVIGGGTAGLAAAALTALKGKSVVLLEQSKHLGGRAVSTPSGGAVLNLGPHAYYRNGSASRVLGKLGISINGGAPGVNIQWMLSQDAISSTPGLLIGKHLSWAEKRQVIRAMMSMRRLNPRDHAGMSWDQFLHNQGVAGRAAQVLQAMARLVTYVGDTSQLDAGAAVGQLQLAVIYPHGGWQTIVDSLKQKAIAAGVHILTEAGVSEVTSEDNEAREILHKILLRSGSLTARNIIVAADPDLLIKLFGPKLPKEYERKLSSLEPVKAACMDLHLNKLPVPSHNFALGTDEPLYMAVHSRRAKLTDRPDDAVVHIMRYDGAEEQDPVRTRAKLEKLMDRLQPGWRKHVLHQRYMPNLTVMHARPVPELQGALQRPSVDTGIPGVYVAGDWVGEEGFLLDASIASAAEAATLVTAKDTFGIDQTADLRKHGSAKAL